MNNLIPNAQSPLIGLLGGSFNPAHDGHVHISREALKHLKLDAVWWLVSPQNPLKPKNGMQDLEERLQGARHITAREKKVWVTDIERQLGTRYTVDIIRALQQHFPRARFVWLMGADNLQGFHRWQGWKEIARRVPIAVLDRAPHTHGALHAPAARFLARWRVSEKQLNNLRNCGLPCWIYLPIRRHPARATDIRNALGKGRKL